MDGNKLESDLARDFFLVCCTALPLQERQPRPAVTSCSSPISLSHHPDDQDKRVFCPAGGTGTTECSLSTVHTVRRGRCCLAPLSLHTAEERWSVTRKGGQEAAPALEMHPTTPHHQGLDSPEQRCGETLFACTEQLPTGRAEHPLPLERNSTVFVAAVLNTPHLNVKPSWLTHIERI